MPGPPSIKNMAVEPRAARDTNIIRMRLSAKEDTKGGSGKIEDCPKDPFRENRGRRIVNEWDYICSIY